MTVKEAYIYIQQGLQNIAAFVYSDVLLPELDVFWNEGTNKLIELAFPDESNDNQNKKYQSVQASLDDLRVLEILNHSPTITSEALGSYTTSYITLPSNYRHLLNDTTTVKKIGCETYVQAPNRLTKSEDIYNLLETSVFKTSVKSPISRLTGNRLYVYQTYKGIKQFDIGAILIDYIKKPDVVAYGSTGNTVLQFPDQVCFKIIDIVLIYIAIVAEQNPNKIQFLSKV
jgi:hypothetical protein